MADIKLARAIADEAWTHYQTLHEKALDAEAEWSRLMLLQIADQHPGVTAFGWNVEYCYDDEGGYFETASGHATVDDEVDGQDAAYDEHGDPDETVCDLNLQPDVVRRLCAMHRHQVGDYEQFELSVADLRAKTSAGAKRLAGVSAPVQAIHQAKGATL